MKYVENSQYSAIRYDNPHLPSSLCKPSSWWISSWMKMWNPPVTTINVNTDCDPSMKKNFLKNSRRYYVTSKEENKLHTFDRHLMCLLLYSCHYHHGSMNRPGRGVILCRKELVEFPYRSCTILHFRAFQTLKVNDAWYFE